MIDRQNLSTVIKNPDTFKAEAELNIRYRRQPWFCKKCKVNHEGGSPVIMREKKEKKLSREERKKIVRTNQFGTSNIR